MNNVTKMRMTTVSTSRTGHASTRLKQDAKQSDEGRRMRWQENVDEQEQMMKEMQEDGDGGTATVTKWRISCER